MTIQEDIKFVVDNLKLLAAIADGNFIDPLVRPKEDREVWTAQSYTADVTKGLEWWSKQPEHVQKRYLHSIKDYTIQALQHEFPEQRARWIYSIVVSQPDHVQEAKDAAHKAKMRALRDEQAKSHPEDNGYRCLQCFKFVYRRDKHNNEIHEKEEVCDCGGVAGLQKRREKVISEYRLGLKTKKQIAEEKQRRVPQR